jgi:Fur family ferric uptake transcriptional regulator
MSLTTSQLAEVRERFLSFLKERGQRRTPERLAVLDALYATADHIDADTLYTRLRTEGVSVSRATVYNTLDLLIECDLAVRHQFGQQQAKFERAYAYWQHDHLICVDCGEILEFCDPRLQEIQETVADIYGFDVARHALTVYGSCRREACPNKTEEVAEA